jgi:hypothetical protein
MDLKLSLHNTKENGVAEIKQTKNIVRRNVTMFSIMYDVMSHKIVSISRDFIIERHKIFVITMLQKISTDKEHNRNSRFIATKVIPKNHRERPTMFPLL